MRGNERVVELLNELLTLELTAVNQYMVHMKMCEDWGYGVLAGKIKELAFDEMRDAEEIIGRVLFLEGVPNVQRLGTVRVGENVTEQLELMRETEMTVLEFLGRAVAVCMEEGDQASREFFAESLPEEEGHVDWLETQLEAIRQVGEENYLSQKLGE